jgi:heat shock protein 4
VANSLASPAGIAQSDLHSAEVVGNASRIPSVIRTIEKVFGQEIRRTLNASESVARGCALQVQAFLNYFLIVFLCEARIRA